LLASGAAVLLVTSYLATAARVSAFFLLSSFHEASVEIERAGLTKIQNRPIHSFDAPASSGVREDLHACVHWLFRSAVTF
jgi:hypothetical protein